MRAGIQKKLCAGAIPVFFAVLLTAMLFSAVGYSFPRTDAESSIRGPWEVLVKLGLEGEGLRFPIEVSDTNKPAELGESLPLMGTPIIVKLEEYLPDLEKEVWADSTEGGGVVARLKITGPGVDQEMWLDSMDTEKDSIASRIGSVAIRKLNDANAMEFLAGNSEGVGPVGVLTVRDEAAGFAADYVIRGGEVISLLSGGPTMTVSRYLPHYSIDAATKEIKNLSERPVNPAVEIVVDDGGKQEKIWLWSKFSAPPHMERQLPMRMKFSDFTLAREKGNYYIISASRGEPHVLYSKDGKLTTEAARFDEPYYFVDEAFTFTVLEVAHGAVIKTGWRNGSETLVNPGIVVTVDSGEVTERIALELNRPHHQKVKSGTLVLLFRRVPERR